MSRVGLLFLGARLALWGGRGSRARMALMASGMAVVVAMLLGLFSVLPAKEAVAERGAARSPVYHAQPSESGAHLMQTSGLWRGRSLSTAYISVDGPVDRLPAGLERLPGPGEVMVSPALGVALAGPHRDELASRLPGKVVGTIRSDGLRGPRELIAWVGVLNDPAQSRAHRPTGAHTFGDEVAPVYVSDNDKIALGLCFVGLLVPIVVLIATLARLSAATRERRLAAIRLIGATRKQTRWLAASETALAAMGGVIVGFALFSALRGPVASLMPVDAGVFGSDVTPPLWLAVTVAIGVPALAVVTSVWALRAVVTSPLGVTRQAKLRTVTWWRLAPLAIGLMMLSGAWLDRRSLLAGGMRGAVLLLGGAGLSLIGLAVAAAAVARLAGTLLHRLGRGPASQLAGRRIEADPGAAARVVTGAMLVVAVVGWLLAFLPLMQASYGGASFTMMETALAPHTMTAQISTSDQPDDPIPAIRSLPGVTDVATLEQINITPEGSDMPVQALIGDCSTLSSLLRSPLTGCGSEPAYRITGGFTDDEAGPIRAGAKLTITGDDGKAIGGPRLPDSLQELRFPEGLTNLAWGAVLLAPNADLSGLAVQRQLFIGTNGDPNTIELVRSALWSGASFDKAMTIPEQAAQQDESTGLYARAALVGVVFALLAAGLSLAVTTADALRERRRGLAALIALGTPTRVLRRSVLLQTAAPLLLNIGLATAASIIGSVLYLGLDSSDGGPEVPLPWLGWATMAAAAVVAVLLSTALTLPFIRAATRPTALRTE